MYGYGEKSAETWFLCEIRFYRAENGHTVSNYYSQC